MKKKIYQRTERMVNQETGELVETNSYTVQTAENEPGFIKLYLQDLTSIHKCAKKEVDVLVELLKLCDYNNLISVHGATKKNICQLLQIFQKDSEVPSVNSFNVILSRLVKKELLIKKSTGQYLANPNLFGKGKWTDIREIRLNISYTPDGRKINAEAE